MAIRLLSLVNLLAGAGLSALFYAMLPMAADAQCSMEPCPTLSEFDRIWQSCLPLAVALALVATAWQINKHKEILARMLLALPLSIVVLWVSAIFVAANFGK